MRHSTAFRQWWRGCATSTAPLRGSNSRADAQFLRNALEHQDIVMKSEGAQVRSWCYVADAVNALLLLLRKGEAGQAYNVANRRHVAASGSTPRPWELERR